MVQPPEAALAVAVSVLDGARAGAPTPLVVAGDRGSGRSHLLASLAAAADGFGVVTAAADPTDGGVPLVSLETAMVLPTRPDGPDGPVHLGAVLAACGLDEPTGRPVDRAEALVGVRRAVEALAERGRVLICVDDLHLADPDSTAVVLHLLRRSRDLAVQVVVTTDRSAWTRPAGADHAGGGLEALAHLTHQGVVRLVELGPLGHGATRDLVTELVGDRPSDALVEEVHRCSGGRPALVEAVVAAHRVAGALVEGRDGTRLDESVDVRLDDELRRRVAWNAGPLTPTARALAGAAATFEALDLDVLPRLAEALGVDGPTLDGAFDELARTGLLVALDDDAGRHRIWPPVLRAALGHEVGPATRHRLHTPGATADPTGDAPPPVPPGPAPPAPVEPAGLPPAGDAASTLVAAGDALADAEPGEAASWYRMALRLEPRDRPAVRDLQLKLTRSLLQSGHHGEAVAVVDEVLRTTEDGPERLEATELAVRGARIGMRYDEAVRMLDGVLEDPTRRTSDVMLQRADVALWQERLDDAAHFLRAARATAGRADDLDADALELHLARARASHAQADAVARRIEEALDRRGFDASPSATRALVVSTAFSGDPRWLLERFGALENGPVVPNIVLPMAAYANYRVGRWDVAVGLAERCLALHEPEVDANPVALGVLALVHAERSEFHAAEEALRRVDQGSSNRVLVDLAEATLAAHRGDGGLRRLLRRRIDHFSGVGRRNFTVPFLLLEIRAALEAGDRDTAARSRAELARLATGGAPVGIVVTSLLADAQVRDDPGAAAEAREVAEEHGLAVQAAAALVLSAVITGDADALVTAHGELGAMGATARQREVARHLRRLGRRVPGTAGGGAHHLTAGEAEVASLVALGRTNRQVADEAGLSVKTVETYLSRVFTKTGCRSRTELVVLVNGGGLRGADRPRGPAA